MMLGVIVVGIIFFVVMAYEGHKADHDPELKSAEAKAQKADNAQKNINNK